MAVLIIIVALLEILAGISVFGAAKSAIHEILATAAFGFGTVTFALGIIVGKLGDLARATATDGGRQVDMSKWSKADRDRYLQHTPQ
ncbi:MAG: hypothetical protein E5W91_32430 [Mesorhizobium sp.]|uniref:hypothetical protein n=1 Tax=Mesorhizobium sp. TaxID=1871066 RepID=UPI00121064E6|nr:hypothetical protein [Mesorhizobium sp.]TIS53096.1 MAG: hypothetical protein E5W91_32430 [Mesorhizobium sp.]